MASKQFKGFDPQAFTKFMQDFLPTMSFYKNSKGEILAKAELIVGHHSGEQKYVGNSEFISKDGINFFQLFEAGYSGSDAQHVIAIDNLYAEEKRKQGGEVFLEMEKWKLYKEGGVYFRVIKPRKYQLSSEIAQAIKEETLTTLEEYCAFLPFSASHYEQMVFHPIPKVRRTEYLLKDGGDNLFFVDCLKYNWDYSDFRVFHGAVDALQEIPILFKDNNPVVRYRDSGTTFIQTAAGTLFMPTRMGDNGFKGKKEPLFTDLENTERVLEHVERDVFDIIYDNDIPKIVFKTVAIQ